MIHNLEVINQEAILKANMVEPAAHLHIYTGNGHLRLVQ